MASSAALHREKLFSILVFTLMTLIPSYCGISLPDYDIVVGDGSNLSFLSISTNKSLNVSVVEALKNRKIKITSVVPDPASNNVYFSVSTRNSSAISVFNIGSNETLQIISSLPNSIGSLTLYQSHLYWCNKTSKSVMRLPVTNWTSISKHHIPELVFSDENATFDSFTIHHKTGVFFYTLWRKSNESEILLYNPKDKMSKVIVTNVYQPKSLHIDNQDNLYWFDNPPGIYFSIERLNLDNGNQRELVLNEQNQHPFKMFSLCSKLYWTDMMNKVLWEFKTGDKSFKPVHHFASGIPYGISAVRPMSSEECQDVVDAHSTTIPTTTIGVPSQACVGQACGTTGNRDESDVTTKSSIYTIPVVQSWPKLCNSAEDGMCLNGATCIVLQARAHCICPSGFSGPTCEEKVAYEEACASDASWTSNSPLIISCVIFSLITSILLVVIAVLVKKLKKHSRQPKIRRRVVVSHRSDIENVGASVCEMIDIENCCNMNVCETPCYERLGSFSAGSSTSTSNPIGRIRRSSVKEDKKCLLSA